MKFSFSLIKRLVPRVKTKKELIEKLNLHSFEVSDLPGDVFDASIPPNRYSDAASHWGIAKEASAILGINLQIPELLKKIPEKNSSSAKSNMSLRIKIGEKNLCFRYRAQSFEQVRVKSSPKWMQKVLLDCGLRPINNVVDIMNYAMLETGQPLHAFDFYKLSKGDSSAKTIIVRKAKNKEKLRTLDDKDYELNPSILVIADSKQALALAGIKGGKAAEIDKNTKMVVVEAANFEAVNIYKSSHGLRLNTDASLRFSHKLSSELVPIGLNRAGELLRDIALAKPGELVEVNYTKPEKKIVKFDIVEFNRFIGMNLDSKTAQRSLKLLGFEIKIPASSLDPNSASEFLAVVPPLRDDIETFEDLAEEVARLYGYNHLKSIPPRVHLSASGFEDEITMKDKARRILTTLGFSEVLNYSFSGEKDAVAGLGAEMVELENPLSAEVKYLRPNLASHLVENIKSNSRFFRVNKIFEIGNVFIRGESQGVEEKTHLGIVIGSQDKEVFFELKGLIEALLKQVGLADFRMVPSDSSSSTPIAEINTQNALEIKSNDVSLGLLGSISQTDLKGYAALAEIDFKELLKLVEEEHEYQPLSKYPSVMRDISISVEKMAHIGDIMQAIQEVDLKEIEDVDLIDEYKQSFTFRIIFQAKDRTLTDREVNEKMKRISLLLASKFGARIR